MATQSESRARIVDAALDLAARRGWRRTSLADIADATDIDLVTLYGLVPSKSAILAAFATRIDEAMLADSDPELADEPVRDRLFAVLMRRFDALQPYREAVRALAGRGAVDPVEWGCGALHLARSMGWALEAAGVGPRGPLGCLLVKGLTAIYLLSLRAWLDDDSDDMGKTMASLDHHLGRADAVMATLCRGRTRADDPESAAPEPAPAG